LVHLSSVPCWPIDTTYYVEVLEGLDLSFIFYFLDNLKLSSLDKSTAIPGLNRNDAYSLSISIPPLPEQHRIVAKIEELFTKLDAGVSALKKIKAQLKRYHQAVLKYAFEGKLTEEWRELHKDELEPASVLLDKIQDERKKSARGKLRESIAMPDLPGLPKGWCWTRLGEIADIKGGITKNVRRSHDRCREVPYLRVANVQRGFLDLREMKMIFATDDDINELILQNGDVLFNEGGDRDKLGRGWVWNGEIPECIHQNHVFRARFNNELINSRFVSHYSNSFGQDYFLNEGKQTTNLASINLGKLSNLPLPIPPIAEQNVILLEIESRLSVADKVEEIIEISLKQSERLRQCVLKTAFEGKLVPQDPNDEPAEKLLGRIKAERAQQPDKASFNRSRSLKQKESI
jgi:type I restriction enzyme S subunit